MTHMPNMPECILFDVDGTLMDTMPDLLSLTNRVLDELGFEGHTRESLYPLMGKNPRLRLIHLALPDTATEEDERQALELWERCFSEHQDGSRPFPGMTDAISCLASQGIALGIVSNKRQDAVETQVRKWFPGRFQTVVGRSDSIPIKPDPAMLEIALSQISTDPSRSIYVGDTAGDMLAAKSAGMTAVAVEWGFQDPSSFGDNAKPDIIVACPDELVELAVT